MFDNMRGPRETMPPDDQQDNADHGEPAVVQAAPEVDDVDDPTKPEELLEEYAWMAEEEEFDQQVIEEFEEEEHIEENFNELWEEEERSLVHFNSPEEGTNGHSAELELANGVGGMALNGNGQSHPEEDNEPNADDV